MEPSRLRRRQRRRVIGNGVLAVSTLLFGTIFVADAKSVTIVVDGHRAEIRTLTDDVAALLESTGVLVDAAGVVMPGPATPLESGMIVVVDSGRTPRSPAERVPPTGSDLRQKWRGALRFQHQRAVEEQRRREARKARIRAARQAEREAARKAAEAAAAAAAAEEAARKAAEATPKSTVTGCYQDWHTVAGVQQLIACAVAKWPVPGGVEKALSVARCEHGFQWYSPPGDSHVGVYQHSAYYWPDRAAAYGFAGYDARNGRANIMVAIQYAHDHGWGAWSCA